MTILVTGATGNIGRMVVDHLLAGGADDVRALTTDVVRLAREAGVRHIVDLSGDETTDWQSIAQAGASTPSPARRR